MHVENEMLPEYKLEMIPLSDEARQKRRFPMSDPEIGHRSKVGEKPTFLQGEEYPICQSCGSKMTFYAQLDAIGDGFDIADCGLIYVFYMCLFALIVMKQSRLYSHTDTTGYGDFF